MSIIKIRNIEALQFYINEVQKLILPADNKYSFFLFTEGNEKDFHSLYPTFNFNRRYLRDVILPEYTFRGIRYFIKNSERKRYIEDYKVRAYLRNIELEKFFDMNRNHIYNFSNILTTINKWGRGNWRIKPVRDYLKSYFEEHINKIPKDKFKRVLIYHYDNNDSFNPLFRLRKFYTLYHFLYNGMENLPFDMILLHTPSSINPEINVFRKLMENKESPIFNRFFNEYRMLRPNNVGNLELATNIIGAVEMQENLNINPDLYNRLLNVVLNEIQDPLVKQQSIEELNLNIDMYNINMQIIQNAIKEVKLNPNSYIVDKYGNKINNENNIITPINDTSSIDMTSINKDIEKLNMIKFTDNVINNYKLIDKNLNERSFNINIGDSISTRMNAIKQSSSHLSDSNIDLFKEDSFNDVINNQLKEIINKHSTDDVKIQVENIKIKETILRQNEMHITSQRTLTIEMPIRLHDNTLQKLEFDIPKLENGYFIINGSRKILLNQLLIPPVYFNKPHNVIIQTIFGLIQMNYAIKNKRHNIRCIYAGRTIELPLALIFYLGFENAMNLMFGGNNWKIQQDKPAGKKYIELSDGYISLNYTDNSLVHMILHQSFTLKSWKMLSKDFLFDDGYISRILVDSRIENLTQVVFSKIIDPINKKVLESMKYPTEIELLMINLIEPLFNGIAQRRNDLNILRLRNSEILYQIINKVLELAYTEYRMKVLSNKSDARIELNRNDIIKAFVTNSLVTSAEFNNILEDVSNKFKVSYTGVETGGLKKEAVTLDVRNLDYSYFGVIDPLETSIGASVGILQHIVPTLNVKDSRGTVQVNELDDNNFDILSTTSSLLPLVNYNESSRAMMAVNQLKQSVQLVNADEPIVRTGNEDNIRSLSSDAFLKRSPVDGTIVKIIENNYIRIIDNFNKPINIPINPIALHSGQGLSGYQEFRVLVNVGDKVVKDQYLAQSKYSFGNTSIKYGKNMFVAFMSWKGFTIEDGIVISDRLFKDKEFESPHTYEHEIFISPEECGNVHSISIIPGKQYTKNDILLQFIPKQLSSITDYISSSDIKDGNILVRSINGFLFDIDGYLVDTENVSPDLLKFVRANNIPIIKNRNIYYKNEKVRGLLLILRFKATINISLGDKLSNRHGNKGVICLIEKEENMPVTPWGQKVDVILSPLGIASRNNFGQLMELYLGLIAKFLIEQTKKISKTQFISLIKRIYNIIDKTKDKETYKMMTSFVSSLTDSEYKKLHEKFTNGFPIVIKPFHGPNPIDIRNVLSILNLKDGYNLYLPEMNTRTQNKISVGYIYMSKLEHMSIKKAKFRGVGRMSALGQPVKTIDDSAQRIGEFDSWGLLANTDGQQLLDEFWTINSDNIRAKNFVIKSIIDRGSVNLLDVPLDESDSMVKKVIHSYLFSLGLDISNLKR